MGLKALLGLESPQERGRRLSLAAYEEQRWYRKETLRRWRAAAVLQLVHEYPDIELLIDIYAKHILGISIASGVLISGLFLDTEFPDIDFVPEGASNSEREAAIQEFRRLLSLWPRVPYHDPERPARRQHLIQFEDLSLFHPISDVCHRVDDKIATRGYIYEPVPLETVASLQIRKNGRLLGQTNPWGQTPLQDLINAIDLEVLLDCSGGRRGVSDLTIDVGVLNYWDCERAFRIARFKQVYMDKPRTSPEINSRERKSICDATKALVVAVYPFVNQKPSDLDELEEFTPGINEGVRNFLSEQLSKAS